MVPNASIGLNNLIIDKYFKMYFKGKLKQYNLNSSEGLVLLMLYKNNERSQEQLISYLHYDKGVIARTMKSLEEKGYVMRMPNPKDNRSSLFSSTEKADELKPHILEILREWGLKLTENVENLEEVRKAMKIMAENAYKTVKGEL